MSKVIAIQEKKINGTWYQCDEHGIPIIDPNLQTESKGLITRYKIIYDVANKTQQQVKEILDLEIRTIMNENPGYKMFKAWTEHNKDGSITYTLQLKHQLLK